MKTQRAQLPMAHQPLRILVVDDDWTLCEALNRALRFAGYEVLLAGSAAEGLRLARALRPDLILSDFNMPGMTGVDLLAEIRGGERAERLPFVLMTGTPLSLLPRSVVSLELTAMLAKPFELHAMLRLVAGLLDGAPPSRLGTTRMGW